MALHEITSPDGRKYVIRTHNEYPPIPDRQFDWVAVDDQTYDGPGCPIGYGATEQHAIIDLIEQLLQQEDAA